MVSRKRRLGTVGAVLMVLALLVLVLLFDLAGSQATAPDTIEINWHTFLGSAPAPGDSDEDRSYDVAVDSAGYAYVVGQSVSGDWGGTLVISHALGLDGFLAKHDSAGAMLWHTFIGGSESDSAQAITTDEAGNLFVVGTSNGGDWGSEPISESYRYADVFVARFDVDGARQWFTFVGTDDQDYGHAVAVDDAGNVYAGGVWVVNPYLARLNGAGEFQWQRVITSTEGDLGAVHGVAVDQHGDVYLTGYANYGDWHGAPPPVRPHAGPPNYSDAFVAKFDGEEGELLWHTFLGATDDDEGHAIVVQTASLTPTLYVAGWSADGWGTPLHPHAGSTDAFVAQLNGDDGTLVWHTFMGSKDYGDEIHAITLDGEGRLFVAGDSDSGWGRPVIPHPGGGVGGSAFVAVLSAQGDFMGHTFVGGATSSDTASGVAVTQQGDVYVSGSSWSPGAVGWSNPHWGTPVRAFSGDRDAFVAGLGARSVIRYWIFVPLVMK